LIQHTILLLCLCFLYSDRFSDWRWWRRSLLFYRTSRVGDC